MARRTKDAPTGRVTPKGGARPAPKPAPVPSGRYTPPIPKQYKESPRWVPVLLLTFLVAGMCTIVANYLGLLPGGAKNEYLFLGLGLITCGFITATRYR
ncbi:MAG: cell division protein CrgA [Actinomycetota bacterium]|nr:cell division protein CrgA [Actinomycetota bacterium]